METLKPKVICIVGPTASGKTSLSIELAKEISAEIISADSMQVYRGLDIGSAKVTDQEKQGTPHHLIDILDINDKFSVAEYKEMCYNTIDDILSRGKKVIIVGGTGLYVSSVIKNMQFEKEYVDNEYRNYLYNLAKENSNEYVYDILKEIDEESAKRIHPNNLKRVIRALEIYKNTGKTKDEYMRKEQDRIKLEKSKYEFLVFGLDFPRAELYERIDKRVDIMLQQGLLDEAKKVYDLKLNKECTCMQAIGYKEFFEYFDGKKSLEESINLLKQETKKYSKRQMTWFKKINNIKWLDATLKKEKLIKYVLEELYENKETGVKESI